MMAETHDANAAAMGSPVREDDVRGTLRRLVRSKHFRALRDDIRNGQVVVFVGPGLPRAAGLGGVDEIGTVLAERIARRLGIQRDRREVDRLRHMGLETLSKLFLHHFGPAQFKQAVLEAQLHQTELENDEQLGFHKKLLAIPFSLVVSTTWDDLLEEAGRHLDPPLYLASITTGEELLGLSDATRPVLIRPRGSERLGDLFPVGHPLAGHEPGSASLGSFLASLFVTHHVLFLGYGVTDPTFLHYQWLFESEYGEQARRIWSRTYFFDPGLSKTGAEWLEQLGLRVLDSGVNAANRDAEERACWDQDLLRLFLEELLAETRPEVTRILRTKRIVDFLRESERLGQDIRVRALTSPIGRPSEEDLKQLVQQRPRLSAMPYMLHDAEYRYQKQLKEEFERALERTVRNGHLARFLLSANIESIQQRTAHPKWIELQLARLVEFFEHGLGVDDAVRVVVRRGTYEVQQYILGDRELAESRRVSASDANYHFARTTKDPREVKAALDLFDLCFEAVALDNFQTLLEQRVDRGRTYLIDALTQAIANREVASVLDPPLPKQDPWAARFRQQLVANEHLTRKDVETLLGTTPPHVVMAVMADLVVFRAIKLHLLQQWSHELETLRQDRPGWLIEVTDAAGEPQGTLQKETYHQLLSHALGAELYNLHAAGFVLTADAQRLILRKRQAGAAAPRFDLGLWDRTVHGHVRHGVHFSQEFRTELVEHFGDCGVLDCEFVPQEQFLDACRRRQEEAPARRQPYAAMLTLQLRGEPVIDTYRRRLPGQTEPVFEPVRTMLYLALLPTAELPRRSGDKHYADWIEIPLADVQTLLQSPDPARPYVGRTVITRQEVEIGPDTMTDQCWKLLRGYADLFAQLR